MIYNSETNGDGVGFNAFLFKGVLTSSLIGRPRARRTLFRGRNYAPLTQTCTAGGCARSCKSRREMRPRKPNETLSRHGRCARRVAFLSPRAMFGEYCSPLDYLYARFKLYQKDEKYIPHFRRTALFPSGGGIPEGKEGEQHSPRDVHPISLMSPTCPPSECRMSSRITPKQTGTDLNPTENTFDGDPEKMFKLGRTRPS